ncbi:MAG: tyrosine-type recombinase/integrase [Rhizobiaceae bacterium]|nr:tyrosine-type recombinase/integrase [Rhizobiaceae bacterium]
MPLNELWYFSNFHPFNRCSSIITYGINEIAQSLIDQSMTELIEEALSLHTKRQAESNCVFPSPSNTNKPIGVHSLTRSFVRLREEHEWQQDIQLYDLRRTATTNLANLGVYERTITRVLNQTDPGVAAVTAVYNQHNYRKEKLEALDLWGDQYVLIIADNER